MKRTLTTLAVALFALGLMVGPVAAQEPPPGPPPFHIPHTHVLLIGADVLDQPDPNTGAPYTIVDYRKCVDLAGGKALRHNKFHENIHFGQAGQALRGAGHIVVPFVTCSDLSGD